MTKTVLRVVDTRLNILILNDTDLHRSEIIVVEISE